jgi:5'-methylthioadenosine phosphorylase
MKIGIIGGTGLEDPTFLIESKPIIVSNEYGNTSSEVYSGFINDIEVFVISRHGLNHEISPSNVNYRANIKALQELNCDYILAITACGSLKEELKPGHFVLPDQFIDWTKSRKNTFFDKSDVIHTPMAEPFNKSLRDIIFQQAKILELEIHNGGTVITIEGPRFSSKSESLLFRQWGCDIINMTTVTEAVLANELNIPYQAIAMVTDYDCWKETNESVSMEMIQSVMKENAGKALLLIENSIQRLGQ